MAPADNLPPLDKHSQLELQISDHEKMSRNNYTLTIKTMLGQKGYSVSVEEIEKSALKKHRKHLKELGEALEAEFINSVLQASTPSELEARILDKKISLTEEENSQMFRHAIRKNLGVKEITEDIIRFWKYNPKNIDNFELLFNTSLEKAKKFDKYEHKHVAAVKRKHIATTSQLLNKMFSDLGIDPKTGRMDLTHHRGFTHKECQNFYDYVSSDEHLRTLWNMHSLGRKFDLNRPCKDPVKFVLEALQRMGLETTKCLKTKKRLSHHTITQESWGKMISLAKARELINIHITSFDEKEDPMPVSEYQRALAGNSPPI